MARIKERYCLNPESESKTYHLVIDLKGSDISYVVGDCLGIYPSNDPNRVESILSALRASGLEKVEDRQGRVFPLRQFLIEKANLSRLPENTSSPQLFCSKLRPLLPRFYSIASSQEHVGQEAHLTVACAGLCSDYLCHQAPLGKPLVPIFLHKSKNFSLPSESDSKPLIMIGPGTGIAPFRGFLQERVARSASSKNWLFFGEKQRSNDFYYCSELQRFVDDGHLILDCAFSRDQAEKVYVQHKMLEKSQELWQWLQEGAYLFVCGDAKRMAKDVDRALHELVEREGDCDAKLYIKDLKRQGRYQRDVY